MARNRTTWRALAATFFLLTGAGIAAAQDTTPIQAPVPTPNCPPPASNFIPKDGRATAAQHATGHGLLWRIEKNDHTSWLYGTVYVTRADRMLPGPTVRSILQQIDSIALELDLLDKDTDRTPLTVQNSAEDRRLLTGRHGERFNRLLSVACLSDTTSTQIRKFWPTMQLVSLAAPGIHADGPYPGFDIDLSLTTYVKGVHLPIVPLGTLVQQVRVLNEIVPKSKVAQQFDTVFDVVEPGEAHTQALTFANTWADSDANTLEHYSQWCGCLKTASGKHALQRLVASRNRTMVESIVRVYNSGQHVFGAMGTFHMIGLKGILTLLAARGYKVTLVLPPSDPRQAACVFAVRSISFPWR